MTEQLHFYFSLSCIGEGNGNPLQCSCLENPRDGGAFGELTLVIIICSISISLTDSLSAFTYINFTLFL